MYIPNEIDYERLGMVDWWELSGPEKFLILKRRGEVMTGQKLFTIGDKFFFWKSGQAHNAPQYIEANSIGEAVNLYLTHYEYANPSDRNSLFALPKPRKTT